MIQVDISSNIWWSRWVDILLEYLVEQVGGSGGYLIEYLVEQVGDSGHYLFEYPLEYLPKSPTCSTEYSRRISAWAFYELARNPDVVKKLRKDIEST